MPAMKTPLRSALLSLAAGMLLAGGIAHAQLAPGEYITQNGWGVLKIEAPAGGAQKFSIEAVGANAHTCSLDGAIRGRQARVATGDKEPPCVVDFVPKGAGIDVQPKSDEACRAFCGARAQFEGLYDKPAPGCRVGEIAKTRTTFKQQYDKKAYLEARATLIPVLDNCSKTLTDIDEGWIRNDLAITLYRLGDMAECQRVLEPLKELAAMSPKQIEENYPPSDAQNQAPIARAARANLNLCKGGKK